MREDKADRNTVTAAGFGVGAENERLINELVVSINDLMRRKLSLLYEIYRYTSEEYLYVQEESMEQLGAVLADKQELISEIDYLDRKFLTDFSALKELLGIASFEELKAGEHGNRGLLSELKLNTKEIMEILTKIDAQDKKVTAKIAKLRDDLTMELVRIRKQRNISTVYSGDKPQRNISPGQNNTYTGSTFDSKK